MHVSVQSNLRSFLPLLTLLLLLWKNSASQCREFILTSNGDTLNCLDNAGLKQGKWVNKYGEIRGEPGYEEEGEYKNGQKTGVWRLYTLQGDLLAIENYHYGNKHAQQQYFDQRGDLVREESWFASNPENPFETVEVYDINNPGKVHLVQVKMEATTVPHGIWKVFEPGTGRLLQKQNFILGKEDDGSGTANGMLKQDDAVTENGEKKETEKKEKEKPKTKEILDFEKSHQGKKKYKVRTGETGF